MDDKITFNDKLKYQISRIIDFIKNYIYDKKEKDKKYDYIRVNSIDVIRGMLTIIVVFLITQGLEDSISTKLVISEWSGTTLADIILPFFILIMGMSIPFYVKKNHEDGYKIYKIIKKSFFRTVIIIALGLLFSILFLPSDKFIRLTGPFQLIGVNYFICVLFYLLFLKLRVKNNALTYVLSSIGVVLSIMLSFIAFKNGIEIEKNIFVALDLKLLSGYKSMSIADPEGIMSILSSLSLGFIGVSLGCIINKKPIDKKYIYYKRPMKIKNNGFNKENLLTDLKSWLNYKSIKSILSNYYRFNNEVKKIVHIFIFSIIFLVLWLIFRNWIPVNRNVFSISFVSKVCCMFYLLEMVTYIICDIIKLRFGIDFLQRLGKNVLLITFFVQIIHKLVSLIKIKSIYTGTWLPFNNWFTTDFILPVFGIEYASSMYAIFITIIWLLIANILEKYDFKVNI